MAMIPRDGDESEGDWTDKELIGMAREARERAYAPYSEYPVGAALLADGRVYTGVNVEVSGRSTSIHAEMLAAFNAVMDGATDFRIMAVATGNETEQAICGLCQHTLSQFTDELLVLMDVGDGTTEYWLSELIGEAYSANTRHADTIPTNE